MNPASLNAEPSWWPLARGLRSFISRRVPASEVDDVLQETFARLHEAAPSLRDTDRAEAWVYAIARRTVADFYRERARADVLVSEEDEIADTEMPATENLAAYEGAHSVHEEVLAWLRPMAEELPEPYRRVLIMVDFEGRTQQDAADEFGLSLSGAKSRVQRARGLLGAMLKRCCELEFGPGGRAVAFRRLEGGCPCE